MKIYIHASADDSYKNKIDRKANDYIKNDDVGSADQFRQELVDERDTRLKNLEKKYSRMIDRDRLLTMFYDGGAYDEGDLTKDEQDYVDEYFGIVDVYDDTIQKLRKFLNSYREKNYSRNQNYIGPKDPMTRLFYGD